MNAVVPLRPGQSSLDDGKMLNLIRRTVAADCNDDEFNLFIWTAKHLRLDPLRRQIYAFVFSKDNAERRRMSIVTAIDGFRTIAERTGNYRPDEDEPRYEFSAEAIDPDTNPPGLVKASVRVFKFSHGSWHPVTATAWWDEYAPIKDSADGYEWIDTGEVWPDSGKPKKKKVPVGTVKRKLDTSGQWGKMPRLMLAKVAEALALRKAWPDDFANVYAAEELDRARTLDLMPAEAAEVGATEARLEKVKALNTILISWDPNQALEAVPVGQLADRVFAFIRENRDEPSAVAIWQQRNRLGLREFWGKEPNDALEVKKALEAVTSALAAPESASS